MEEEFRTDIEEQKLNVFVKVISAPDLRIGVQTLIQSFREGEEKAKTAVQEAAQARVEADQAAQSVKLIERGGSHEERG